jgi:DNA helicase-2/ATP-dependent DNA helicase PcrA
MPTAKPPAHKTVTQGDLILRGLNDKQQDAVRATTGPVLILAGAGSGKTKTLVHRIAYLIAAEGVKPWNILAVTFTNKAAANMRERMKDLLGEGVEHGPMMGTFHSVCSKLLRKEIEAIGFSSNFVIYDDQDQLTLVKKIMKDLGYDTKQIAPSGIHWKISGAKNLLLTPDEFAGQVSDAFSEVAAKVYPRYQQELQQHNALDFDDLIMKTVQLFSQYPEVLAKYQNLWQHVLVDEYQDTNRAQYQLVTLLADAHKNICVVGDDFQSIYSWRMADITNILNFEKDYPDAVVVLLEQNYRSTQTILDASNAVIAKNPNQKEKTLWTDKAGGHPIVVKEVENEQAEGRYVVEQIVGLNDEAAGDGDGISYDDEYAQPDPDEAIKVGESILDRVMGARMFTRQKEDQELAQLVMNKRRDLDFSRFVVLYRTNAQSRAIEEAFLKYNVPYQLVGGIRFYDRREIKDVLAYLRVLFNPADWVSLERIANVPARGIGDRTWFKVEQFCRQRNWDFLTGAKHAIPDIQNARLATITQFAETLRTVHDKLVDLNPTEIVDLLLKEIGYKDYLLSTADSKEQGETRWENVQELKTVTQKFANLRGAAGLEAFLEDITLVSDQDSVDETENAVKLMTVHAAKGLEFPEVFVVGMEEGLFPHARALTDPREMEEERRLCYVALTRAIDKIHLVFAAQRMRYGNLQVNPPSRFLDDIPSELADWQ